MTLDDKTRDELTSFAVELLYESLADNIMTNVELIEDEDRYYNWYHGYTELKLPYIKDATGEISYQVTTTAISGNISTQYFGNKFDSKT